MTIQEYLSKTINHLGITGDIGFDIQESDDHLNIAITVPEDSVALMIGNRGETLEAIELLTKLAFKDEYSGKRIILDINNYRQQNMEKLKEKALDIAYRVLETRRPYEFRNLNSFERYQLHSLIAENTELSDLTSFSEDRETGRVLIVAPKELVAEEESEVGEESELNENIPVEGEDKE